MKSNQDLLNDKIKECIFIIEQLSGKSFKESTKLFSKLYVRFLKENQTLIQESLHMNVKCIDLFENALLQCLDEQGILNDCQEKFFEYMLTSNDYIEENREFIKSYYDHGMRFVLNEGIDKTNYRSVILLNEIKNTNRVFKRIHNYRVNHGYTKNNFTGDRSLWKRTSQRFKPWVTGTGAGRSFWDGTKMFSGQKKYGGKNVLVRGGTRVKKRAQKFGSAVSAKAQSAVAGAKKGLSDAKTAITTKAADLKTRASTWWKNRHPNPPPPPPPPPKPKDITQDQARSIVTRMGFTNYWTRQSNDNFARGYRPREVASSNMRNFIGIYVSQNSGGSHKTVGDLIDTMKRYAYIPPQNNPTQVQRDIQQHKAVTVYVPDPKDPTAYTSDPSRRRVVGNFYQTRLNLFRKLKSASKFEYYRTRLNNIPQEIAQADFNIQSAIRNNTSPDKFQKEKDRLVRIQKALPRLIKGSERNVSDLAQLLGYPSTRQGVSDFLNDIANVKQDIDNNKTTHVQESKLCHDIYLVNKLKEVYRIH